MDSKRPNRRGFLKGGAAAASLAAAGVPLAEGQTQGTPAKKLDELIAYGERSRFVTSMRVPMAERHSPDGFGRDYHAILALLYGDAPRRLCSGHRSRGASSHDPRDGGPPAGFHHGRAQASPVRIARSLH